MGKGTPPRKIGLALGSGAALGWAHIGVIDALSEAGVRPYCVAGTSIGALVGAAYASGKIHSLETVARELDWRKVVSLFDVGFRRSGLIDGRKIADSIREQVKPGMIEDLPMPFCAVCTDLASGTEVLIDEGDVVEAVRASISISGMFTPVGKGKSILVDGGLVNPVPVSVARRMGADYVIAVDLTYEKVVQSFASRDSQEQADEVSHDAGPKTGEGGEDVHSASVGERIMSLEALGMAHIKHWLARESMPNIFEILMASMNVMERQITELHMQTEPADLLIRPKLGHLGFMDFHKAEEAILEGYTAARSSVEQAGDAGQSIGSARAGTADGGVDNGGG